MKKLLFTLLILLTSKSYSQSITTLSCIDRDDSKFQQVIKFNSFTKKIIDPSPSDYDLSVTDDLISFKRKTDDGGIYNTLIYRNTGQFTIYGKTKGVDYIWTGTCSKVTQNKF